MRLKQKPQNHDHPTELIIKQSLRLSMLNSARWIDQYLGLQTSNSTCCIEMYLGIHNKQYQLIQQYVCHQS